MRKRSASGPRARPPLGVLVRCSDPRINAAVARLQSSAFGAGTRWAPIANTGGIKYFLAAGRLSELGAQFEILIHHFGASRALLVSHTDCGYYQKLGEDEPARYPADLKAAHAALALRFPQLIVRCFLVETASGRSREVKA